jgi:hypothetical protein
MFGTAGSAGAVFSDQAVSDARFLIELAKLMVDPEGASDQIRQLIEERKKVEHAVAEVTARERAVAERERELKILAETLAAREADLAERDRQAAFHLQGIEQRRVELQALKNELRGWAKAAA